MPYNAYTGDVGDATYRNQITNAIAGNAVIDGCGVSLGGSTTAIETRVESGVVKFGNQYPGVDQQTVTHPDGPPPEPGRTIARVDAVTVNRNGTAGVVAGEPDDVVPADRRFPRVRTPTLPAVADPALLVVGALWVPAGAGSAAELYDDYVTPREIMGDGLNQLQLIPGRDLQYVLDSAREGETLRGDRSAVVTLPGPLVASTPGITIRDLNLRYADAAASTNTDDMLTLAADDITVENVTIDGNKTGQPADVIPDGITVEASGCTVRTIRGHDTAGYLVNVNGGTASVEDTTIEQVIGVDLGRDVLVIQGAGALRTTARTIRGIRTGTATVLVRNGPSGTALTNIYGEAQDCVVRMADFGPDNPDSAQITALFMDNVRGNGAHRLVAADTATALGHRGIVMNRLAGRNFDPPAFGGEGGSIVNIEGLTGVRITNSALSDDYTGAYAIAGANVFELGISNVTLANNSGGYGCIALFNSEYVNISQTICHNSPGYGIRIRTSDGLTHNGVQLLGNLCRNVGGDGIALEEFNDSVLDFVMVKNNLTDNLVNEASGPKVVNTDNFILT